MNEVINYVIGGLIGAGLVSVIAYVIANVKSSFVRIDNRFTDLENDLDNRIEQNENDVVNCYNNTENQIEKTTQFIHDEIFSLNSRIDSLYDKHLHKYHSEKTDN